MPGATRRNSTIDEIKLIIGSINNKTKAYIFGTYAKCKNKGHWRKVKQNQSKKRKEKGNKLQYETKRMR